MHATSSPAKWPSAIVEALQYRIVEVWVPKSASRTQLLAAVLPRSLSEGFAHAIKADRVLAGADFDSRRNYELRASRSEPGLEGPPPQPQIWARRRRPGCVGGTGHAGRTLRRRARRRGRPARPGGPRRLGRQPPVGGG